MEEAKSFTWKGNTILTGQKMTLVFTAPGETRAKTLASGNVRAYPGKGTVVIGTKSFKLNEIEKSGYLLSTG